MKANQHRSLAGFTLLLLLVVLSGGCGRFSTDYGVSRGVSGRSSVNGFGFLRHAYEEAGFKSRDISRLSDRVLRSDVIVWTPQVNNGIATDATRWFERWLRLGDHTLIYVLPDSGSETEYWQMAASLAPPEQRLEYRRRAAESINRRIEWRLNRTAPPSNGWFEVEPLEFQSDASKLQGEWQTGDSPLLAASASQPPLGAIEFKIAPFEKSDNTTNNNGTSGFGPTGPSSTSWNYFNSTSPTSTKVRFRPQLETAEKHPVVAEITSASWNDSRVLVVTGGSMLTNFALTNPSNQRLAAKLIQGSKATATKRSSERSLQAGFLTTDSMPLRVSERTPGVPAPTGMEILTTWPLSLVTMHGVFLGVVLCLMLLPIFGRPRRVRYSDNSDFGHHLDAVAALMNKSGGEAFARQRISEYFKHVHGEHAGPWIIADETVHPTNDAATSTHGLTPRRLSVRRSDPSQATDASRATDPSQATDDATESRRKSNH